MVRELFRRFEKKSEYASVFVDLEAALSPQDAIAEIGVQCRQLDGIWGHVRRAFGGLTERMDEVGIADLRIKLRSEVDAANWSHRGDELFRILASWEERTVLAVDELPMLVSSMLQAVDSDIRTENLVLTKRFLSWLRKNGQAHRDKVSIIASGSVGLHPILQDAGLTAYANIFSPLELKSWSEEVANGCLEELAKTDGITLPNHVRREMCRRLRCCVPHHVQQFYFYLFEELVCQDRRTADLDDVDRVYQDEMLGMSGQVDLHHYETRLNAVLGARRYWIARELLTEAAVNNGILRDESVKHFVALLGRASGTSIDSVRSVLRILEHDGYLCKEPSGYRFVSGLVEAWWRKGHGGFFVSFANRVRLTG